MNCPNCSHDITDTYCGRCGQRAITRFNWAMADSWIRDELFVLDRGFFFTIKELWLRPTRVINDYLQGATKKYVNPFKLLLVLTTTPIALFLLFSNDPLPSVGELFEGWPSQFSGEAIHYFLEKSSFFLVPNLLYHFFIVVVLLALGSKLMFQKRGLNLVENLIFTSFMGSFFLLLVLSTLPVWLLMPWISNTVLIIALCMVYAGAGVHLIRESKKFYGESFGKTFFKGVIMLYTIMFLSYALEFVLLSFWKLMYDGLY
jgi:Protein of unknown function (DUF3667)